MNLPTVGQIYGRATAVLGDKIYAFGGVEHAGPLSTSSVFSTTTNSWSSLPGMPGTRSNPGAAEAGGKLYVFGGSPGFGGNPGADATFRYDPVANSWATMASMPRPRIDPMAATIGNKIYVMGGTSILGVQGAIDVYDTTTNTWQMVGTMQNPVAGEARAYQGKILVTGGYNTSGANNTLQSYDPVTGNWSMLDPMGTPRSGPGVAVLNNKLYAFAGENSAGYLSSVESFNLQRNIQPIVRDPSPGLISLPTFSTNLVVLSNNGVVDQTKPTIVLSHGINSDPSVWAQDYAQKYTTQGAAVNVVAWNWETLADVGLNVRLGASRAALEGDKLSVALIRALGSGYSQPIHFIGHSMGTRVNRWAADILHANGFAPQNTQVSILDSPDLGNLDTGFYDRPTPAASRYIDNYIGAVGDYRADAVNIILRNTLDLHSYPHAWYGETILRPDDVSPLVAGNRISLEGNSLSSTPALGSTYAQTASLSDDELRLVSVGALERETILGGRNLAYFGAGGLAIVGAIKLGAVNTIKLVGKGAIKYGISELLDTLELEEGSPSYAWFDVHIPSNARWFSFDFVFDGSSHDDYLSFGINDELLFALEGRYAGDGNLSKSGLIDIARFAGQDVEFFFGLNSDSQGQLRIGLNNLTFLSLSGPTHVSEPPILLLLSIGVFLLSVGRRNRGRNRDAPFFKGR